MRHICGILLLATICVCTLFCTQLSATEVGEMPPSLGSVSTLNTVNGKPVQLSSLKGRVVLIDFWATWCGPCVSAMPHIQHLHEAYGDRGLVVIGHTDTSSRDLENFLKKKGSTYICSIGTNIGDSWGVSGIPHVFLLNTKGVVIWHGHPARLQDSAVEAALKDVSPLALAGGYPGFEKRSGNKSVYKEESKVLAGKVGSGLKGLEKIIVKNKSAEEVASAEASKLVIQDWIETSNDEIEARVAAGDMYEAGTRALFTAAALSGHDLGKTYKAQAKEYKKNGAYKIGKKFQVFTAVRGAARKSPGFVKAVNKFIKKHQTGYYVDQAQAMLE